MLRAVRNAASTPPGQAIIAEALIAAAHALARKHPVAAAETAAAGAAGGARTFGAALSEAAVKFLYAAADVLRSGKQGATSAAKGEGVGKPETRATREGNGASSIWDAFDEEAIRRAFLAALGQDEASGKKRKRRATA